MLIHDSDRVVRSLSKILPNAFVFVIDTTDRTFLFKSDDKIQCQNLILKLDTELGIDKTAEKDGHFFKNFCSREIGMKSLAANTFVGYCLETPTVSEQALSHARDAVIN